MAKKRKHTAAQSTEKESQSSKQADAKAPLPLSLTEDVGKTDTLTAIIDHYNTWLPRYQTFSQGRSNFQIEKMIATEHATPAASYQHTLYQLRVLHQSLMTDFIKGIEAKRTFEFKWADADRTKPQWWKEGKDGKKLSWYDTDKIRHEHEIEELKMSVKDKLQQLDTFTKILQAMEQKHGGPFTQAELDEEEPEYWKLRIARQMGDEYLDRQTGLGTGNIKTLRMATADSPLPGSKNRVENFPDLINAVLSGRETSLEALNQLNEELFGQMNNLGAGGADAALDTPADKPKQQESEGDKQPTLEQSATKENQSDDTLDKLRSVGIGVSRFDK